MFLASVGIEVGRHMDYNTIVIVNNFRKEMFLYSIGICISILLSNPYTIDFGLS